MAQNLKKKKKKKKSKTQIHLWISLIKMGDRFWIEIIYTKLNDHNF